MRKLFVWKTLGEGDAYDTEAFLSLGRKTTISADKTIKGDGFYISFIIPVGFTRKYMDVYSFDTKQGKCYPSYLLRVRKVLSKKFFQPFFYFTWKPVNPNNDKVVASIANYDFSKQVIDAAKEAAERMANETAVTIGPLHDESKPLDDTVYSEKL